MTEYNVDFNDILGYGNYGTVYGATNKSNEKQQFAVKIFKSADASAEEIEIMEYLSKFHFTEIANIVEVLNVNGRKAIVMERLDGGEVFERILSDGQFSEHRAARCIVNLVRALIDLNKKAHVLHRDVKPENLVYVSTDGDSDVKLIDFGLAIKASPFAIEQGIRLGKRPAGTASYMSPETVRNCEYSAKSDVWSAGVTLYALLSGTAPFDQDNRLNQRKQILAGQYIPLDSPQWSHVTEDAKDLVRRMLTVNSVDRIALDEVLLHPWIKSSRDVASVNFGERYWNDMRSLSARSNFKKVVNATILTLRMRKSALTALDGTKSTSPRKSLSAPVGNSSTAASEDGQTLPTTDSLIGLSIEQIKQLKERFSMVAIESGKRRNAAPSADSRDLAIDYDAFASVMYAVGLESFATPRVFHIFDADGNGTVDYREFITTLATFRGNDEETWRLYFDMFDIDGSGEISFEELKLVVATLLHEDDDCEQSEHDRSSPVPDILNGTGASVSSSPSSTPRVQTKNSPSQSRQRDERSISAARIDVDTSGTIFQFVPDDSTNLSLYRKKSYDGYIDTAIPLGGSSPVRLGSLTSDGSFVSGRVSRVASFQSVFRFTPKVDDDRTIEDLFREMDTNKDGKITFDEFKGWMKRDMAKLRNAVQDAIN